jgi:hypothetical protein|tara:strand:+ start:54 stop:1064 length:1011 start_codon:yes stop_codon:yes gene_type:complete
MEMQISVINKIEDLLLIKEEWDKLFIKGDYSVFQSFKYCFQSAKINNSQLFVIVLEDNEQIIEVWPCEIINKKLRFINDRHSDFCDILSKTNSYKIVQFIKENSHVKGVYFINLKENSLILNKIKNLSNSVLNQKIDFSALYLERTENFPDNFKSFVYRQKRRLKRILKKYSAQHTILTSGNDPFPFNELIILREEMIINGSRKKSFFDDKFLDLCNQLYQTNNLIISKVKVNDKNSAMSLIFKNNNEYSFWVDLYNDMQMMNLYHNARFIKEITSKESAIFNFGRGIYKYKLQNFNPEVFNLYEFMIFNNVFLKVKFILKENIEFFLKSIYKKLK